MNQAAKIFKFRCRASLTLVLALLVSCSVFLSLSYWQLHKGIIKRQQEQLQMQSRQSQNQLSALQAYQSWKKNPLAINDRTMQVAGLFQADIFILHDNRIHQGQAGYNIYGLFKLAQPVENKTHLLINLGWSMIPDYNRQTLPNFQLEPNKNFLKVRLEYINPNIFTLADTMPETLNNAASQFIRVQSIQFQQLQQMLQVQLIPFVGRATENLTQPELILALAPLAERGISADKHFGYSLQWLLFCLIAIGIFLYTQCSWYDNLHDLKK